MLFVVLVRNRFGLRDAWYVNGDNIQDALTEASGHMLETGITQAVVTILPAKENRTLPFLFPDDPDTDAELMLDFLRGHVRPVFLDYPLVCALDERRKEHSANVKAIRGDVPLNMVQFQMVKRAEQTEE